MKGVSNPPFGVELYRRNIRNYGESNFGNLFGIGTTSLDLPTITINTGTPLAANRERCLYEGLSANGADAQHWCSNQADIIAGTNFNFWRRDHVMQALMKFFPSVGTESNEQRAGIGMSNFNLALPWPNPSLNPVVMFWVNTLALQWELISSIGDNVTPWTTAVLSGVQAPRAGDPFHLKLVYKAGEYAAALVNGIEGARIDDPLLLPPVNPPSLFSNNNGLGIFVHSGSLAGRLRAQYTAIRCETMGID